MHALADGLAAVQLNPASPDTVSPHTVSPDLVYWTLDAIDAHYGLNKQHRLSVVGKAVKKAFKDAHDGRVPAVVKVRNPSPNAATSLTFDMCLYTQDDIAELNIIDMIRIG